MKVCFVVGEIFAWGKFGGFGFLTRKIGAELVQRGIEVHVLVPMAEDQKPLEQLDGMLVHGYEGGNYSSLRRVLEDINVDIFHSQEPNIATYFAQKIHPQKKHIVTFQDPRKISDWINEFIYADAKKRRAFPGMLRFESALHPLVRRAAQKADAAYSQAKYITELSQDLYGLKTVPSFLPNPVDVPMILGHKSKKPTVCFLARWDKRKRPEKFIQLAHEFPNIDFMMMGKINEKILEKNPVPVNLSLVGMVYGEEKERILDESWALVNTSTRECLPVSFLEASARECSIISAVDPDGFASKFGFLVKNDDYAAALRELLREGIGIRGKLGRQYVLDTHETKNSIDQHLAVYRNTLTPHGL